MNHAPKLYDGSILKWLEEQGIHGAATKVREITTGHKDTYRDASDASLGLDEFLEWTGYVDAPVLAVSDFAVDLGLFAPGYGFRPRGSFEIANQGGRCLKGLVEPLTGWLSLIQDPAFLLVPGESCTFEFEADVDSMPCGRYQRRKALRVTSTNEERLIYVTIEILTPKMSLSSTELDFGSIDKRLSGSVAPQVLTVANPGAGVLTGTIVASAEWIQAKPNSLRCPSGQSRNISISIVNASLPYQEQEIVRNVAQLKLRTNAGVQIVGISCETKALPPNVVIEGEIPPLTVTFLNADTSEILLRNAGDGLPKLEAKSDRSWLTVTPAQATGRSMKLGVRAFGAHVTPGETQASVTVTESSTGKQLHVPVTVRRTFNRKQSALAWMIYVALCIVFLLSCYPGGALLPWGVVSQVDLWDLFWPTALFVGLAVVATSVFVWKIDGFSASSLFWVTAAMVAMIVVAGGHSWLAYHAVQRVIGLKGTASTWGAVILPLVGCVPLIALYRRLIGMQFFSSIDVSRPL